MGFYFDKFLGAGRDSYGSGSAPATYGNWKVFYSNGSGALTELALGASGTLLKSNGASSAPSFLALITNWTAYTPTGSWVSNCTYTGFWRRVGDTMEVQVQIAVTGAVTSANLTVAIPATYTIDTAKLVNSTAAEKPIVGTLNATDSSVSNQGYSGIVTYASTTTVAAFANSADSSYVYQSIAVKQDVPVTFDSGDRVFLNFRLPISEFAI